MRKVLVLIPLIIIAACIHTLDGLGDTFEKIGQFLQRLADPITDVGLALADWGAKRNG